MGNTKTQLPQRTSFARDALNTTSLLLRKNGGISMDRLGITIKDLLDVTHLKGRADRGCVVLTGSSIHGLKYEITIKNIQS